MNNGAARVARHPRPAVGIQSHEGVGRVEGSLGSGRRADPHPAQAHPAAGRNPRRPTKPSRCASMAGAAQGHRRAGRRGAGGRPGRRTRRRSPAWRPDGGCQPAASRIASPPAALGGTSWAGSRGLLTAWALASRADQRRPGRRRAHRCRAPAPPGSRWSRRAPPKGCVGPAPWPTGQGAAAGSQGCGGRQLGAGEAVTAH
jgi:hypothetical protein